MSPGFLSKMGARFFLCLGLVFLVPWSVAVPVVNGANAEGGGNNRILSLTFSDEAGDVKVLIRTERPVGYRYTLYDAIGPYRVVVDLPEMAVDGFKIPAKIDSDILQEIRVSTFELPSGKVGRLEFLLKKTVTFNAAEDDNSFSLLFRGETAVPAPQKPLLSPATASVKKASSKIKSVDIEPGRAVIETDGSIEKYRYFGLKNPERLVLDIYEASPEFKEQRFSLAGGFKNLRIGPYTDKTRFVFDSAGDKLPSYDVKKSENLFVVSWESGTETVPEVSAPAVVPAVTPEIAAQPSEQAKEPVAVADVPVDQLLTVEAMDFSVEDGKSVFTVTLSRPGQAIPLEKVGNVIRFGVKNAHLPQRLRRTFDCSSFPSAVRIITPYIVVRGNSEEVRFAADLRGPVPAKVTQKGKLLIFEVENGVFAEQDSGSVDIDIKTVQTPSTSETKTVVPAAPLSHPVEVAESGIPGINNGPAVTAADFEAGRNKAKYTGTKVSLVFDEADIRKIFQLLGEVSNLNLVLGEEVKGSVSLRLVDVPWDQAFDLILEMKELGKLQDGNIVRILPRKKIAEMDEARLTAARTKEKLDDLVTVALPVSYTSLKNLEKPIKDRMTDRGRVTLDERNKQLVVIDVPTAVDEIKNLIKIMDTPERQVMIEARIVEVSDTNEFQLGVNWGITNVSDQSTSNVGLGGGFVLPPAAITSGLSSGLGSLFSYSGINSTTIDLRLSAAESAGNVRIISKPRVVTLNGEKATIAQGTSIPYQTATENEIKTEWIDANLELEVVPIINPDNSVILEIVATNNQPSTTLQSQEMPAIDKKEAKTKVLVQDGETTVIGGIFVESENFSTAGVPMLRNLPVLGHLFKWTKKTSTRAELLVFITPKILE